MVCVVSFSLIVRGEEIVAVVENGFSASQFRRSQSV